MPTPIERRLPLSASSRYYPGFLGALFLVLLRMAIGWHFFHEGHEKWASAAHGSQAFSAEGYLRGSVGPFAPHFRALIPDPDSRNLLDPVRLESGWDRELLRVAAYYGFDEAQTQKAQAALATTKADADAWFGTPENVEKLKKYRDDLESVRRREAEVPAMSFEQERLEKDRKSLEESRRALIAPIVAWDGALRESWQKLATEEQAARGPIPAPASSLMLINQVTTYGLMAVGLCLMLGLLTPVAALGAAGYLLMFYLSMPPWPGLPENPMAEGHYLFVNKNLIEMIACLALACTPTGLWIGLDALLFGWISRRRAAAAERAEAVAAERAEVSGAGRSKSR